MALESFFLSFLGRPPNWNADTEHLVARQLEELLMHAIEPLRHCQGRKADIQMFIFGFDRSPISNFQSLIFRPYNAGMNGKTGRRDLCVKTDMF